MSSEKVDPDLGAGFAYFVPEKDYKDYLHQHKDDVELVRCTVICTIHNHILTSIVEIQLLAT